MAPATDDNPNATPWWVEESLRVEHTTPPRRRGQRGKSPETLTLVARAKGILGEQHPHSVRGVCYQLFVNGWLRSMAKLDTDKVSKHLVWAREQGIIPWDWIVDESRPDGHVSTWRDLSEYLKTVARSFRLDYWDQQPLRVQVWSEKATVSGILGPVLRAYAVDWCYVHGYNSATKVHEKAQDSLRDARQLIVLYVGDYDCSGMHMNEYDLPRRLARYGGRVTLRRIALTAGDVAHMGTLAYPAKRTDRRYNWYVARYGTRAWELDAMNPNDLRTRVEEAIRSYIDWPMWERCKLTEDATTETITNLIPIISRQATK
jgi:hypothetical protein